MTLSGKTNNQTKALDELEQDLRSAIVVSDVDVVELYPGLSEGVWVCWSQRGLPVVD